MDVILYQSGSSPCLRYCLESLRTHSPASKVTIIGEDVSGHEFVSEAPYLEAYNRFLPTYEHHSPNPPHFELLCLRRWMVINEYIRAMGIEECVSFDSDVMCFCNLKETLTSSVPITFYSYQAFAWIKGREGLGEVVERILWIYANKDSQEWKALLSEVESGKRPSICDMSILELFMANQPYRDLGFESPHGRCSVFDRNICETFNFMVQGDRKRIFFYDGHPYAITTARNIVRLNTVHCWGPYKRRMDTIWRLAQTSVGKPDPVLWK